MLRLLLAALLALSPDLAAQPVRDLAAGGSGRIEFFSATPAGPTELMRREGRETPIVGTLVLPPGGGGRVPAMIIAHGSGGISEGRENAWAKRLGALGLATFVVDSFAPRGILSTADDQTQLPLAASVADALHAFRLLATHPGVDPARIGVLGFSKGGQVALYSALEPFRRAVLDEGQRFALHIGLYASCSVPYLSQAVTGAPMLLLLGGADDYTPAAHCARYADWFRGKGAEIRVVTYPGAPHGFDTSAVQRWMAGAQTVRGCDLDIELEPVRGRRRDTGEELPPARIGPYLRSCSQRGATFGGNGAAREAAIEEVRSAVQRHLRAGR